MDLETLAEAQRDLPKAKAEVEAATKVLREVLAASKQAQKDWAEKEKEARRVLAAANRRVGACQKAEAGILASLPREVLTARDQAAANLRRLEASVRDTEDRIKASRLSIERATKPFEQRTSGSGIIRHPPRMSREQADNMLRELDAEEGDLALLRQDVEKARKALMVAQEALDRAFAEAVGGA